MGGKKKKVQAQETTDDPISVFHDTRQLLSRCHKMLKRVEWRATGQVFECPVEGGWSFAKKHRSACELAELLADLETVLAEGEVSD